MENRIFIKIFLLIILLVILVGVMLKKKEAKLTINGQTINVEIADNEISRGKGLSGKSMLAENQGMLFVYSRPGRYSFWMNLMKFNLDFIYIKGNKVVDLIEDVPNPKMGEMPKIVNAKTEFDKVLEVNSGTIGKIRIKIGDLATLKNE